MNEDLMWALNQIELAEVNQASELDLSGLNINEFPIEIIALKHLEVLDLSSTSIQHIPSKIGELRRLRVLDIHKTKVRILPPEIGNLINLRELNVNNTYLREIPPELSSLKNLVVIDCSDTKIDKFPDELSQWNNVRSVIAENCTISEVPEVFLKFRSLSYLYLSDNDISTLPFDLKNLKNLRFLALARNPLPIPREYLLTWEDFLEEESNFAQHLLNYYFVTRHEPSRPIREAKVLILGEAGVGKSAIVERIITGNYNPTRFPTEGIIIKDKVLKVGRQRFTVHLWDFGGQEIMHATHQFFLAARALYILVLDSTQNESTNRLENWLKLIRLYAKDAPIIVVINKNDLFSLRLDQKGLDERYNVAAFLTTSCASGEGISDLLKHISVLLPEVPSINDLIPDAWRAVQGKIKQQGASYLTYQAFKDLCREEHIPEDQVDSVATFFDALGIALRYQDSFNRITHVLDPNWVTQGIYPIVRDPILLAAGGLLQGHDIARLLENRYSELEQFFILDMMMERELAFKLDYRNYLLPTLLGKERPNFRWEEEDSVKFIYEYEVLPPNLFERFIIRKEQEINRSNILETVWRTGVLLHRFLQPYALVTSHPIDHRIIISVRSNSRDDARTLLDGIRDTLEDLHRSFEGLIVTELIPLPGVVPTRYANYRELLEMEEIGETRYVKGRYVFDLSELLGRVAAPSSRKRREEERQYRNRSRSVHSISDDRTTIVGFFSTPYDVSKLNHRTEHLYLREILGVHEFSFIAEPHVTAERLRRTLRDNSPQIVYFSGHGVVEGLVIEQSEGTSLIIEWELIAELIEDYQESFECVIVNCCHADELHKHFEKSLQFRLITQRGKIEDRFAIAYMQEFFDSFKSGHGYAIAHREGKRAMQMLGYNGDLPEMTEY